MVDPKPCLAFTAGIAIALSASQPLIAQTTVAPESEESDQESVPPALAGMMVNPESRIKIEFPNAVSIEEVSRRFGAILGVNIIIPEDAANQMVIFQSAVEVPKKQLMFLLSSMLEDHGHTVQQTSETIYRVVQIPQAKPNINGGDVATTRLIRTPGMKPSRLRDMLQTTYQQNQFRISSLDDLGLIILTGPSATLSGAQQLIDAVLEARAEQRFYVLDVQSVSPSVARARMLELDARINNTTTTRTGVQPNAGDTAQAGGGGPLSNLSERLFTHVGNSLLYRGTEAEFESVRTLLTLVDRVSPLIAKPYTTGSVTLEVASTAEALGLGTPAQIGGTAQPSQQVGRANIGGSQNSTVPALSSGSSMLIDIETGRITYFGTASQHDQFKDIVDDFRKDAVDNGQQIRIYKLLYASADGSNLGGGISSSQSAGAPSTSIGSTGSDVGVAELLRLLISNEGNQAASGRFLPSGSNPATQSDQIFDELSEDERAAEASIGATRLFATAENTTIVADPARNQLLIKAPARAHEQLEQIIAQLDIRQPQVFLDIQIISVTTTDGFDWRAGVDLSIGQFEFFSDFGVLGTGADSTLSGVPTAPVFGNSGLTTGIIKSDFLPFVINTIASQGDTRFVSQPQLLVNDNQEARYESAAIVPFAETTQNASTTTTGQGGTASAGTIVEVRPRISKAGEVTLDLSLELSSFTAPAQNGLQPPEQTDNYESLITLPANSTVIVGGFQTSTTTVTESKIPILGDIPLLGNAFKSYSEDETLLTLYIFITPRVISSVSDRGLHLLTEGPLKASGFDDGTPRLLPQLIRVSSRGASEQEKTTDRINDLLSATGIGPANPISDTASQESSEQD